MVANAVGCVTTHRARASVGCTASHCNAHIRSYLHYDSLQPLCQPAAAPSFVLQSKATQISLLRTRFRSVSKVQHAHLRLLCL